MNEQLEQRAAERRQTELGGQEAAPGYAVNGESKWTRQAAAFGKVTTQPTRQAKRERQEYSRLDLLITHEAAVVARLERRAAEAKGDPDKHAKICVRLQRTRFLLDRLRREQMALVS